jgi:hypothetical protein
MRLNGQHCPHKVKGASLPLIFSALHIAAQHAPDIQCQHQQRAERANNNDYGKDKFSVRVTLPHGL